MASKSSAAIRRADKNNNSNTMPSNYDSDGRTDIAVNHDGTWYTLQSSNRSISYQYFGASSDIPVAAANTQ